MECLTLLKKLHDIQKAINYVQKDAKSHNYKYASGMNVIKPIRDMMNDKGLILIPSASDPKIIPVDVANKQGNKPETAVSAEMCFVWVDVETGEELRVEWAGYAQDGNDIAKASGKMYTYEERYFLLKFFHIPTDEDDPDRWEKKNGKPEPKPEREQPDHEVWINLGNYHKKDPKRLAEAMKAANVKKPITKIKDASAVEMAFNAGGTA